MQHFNEIIIGIMLAAGILGGALNLLLVLKELDKEDIKKQLCQSLLGGVVASFMVPLFLNMISSTLLDSIKGTSEKSPDPSKLFVFAGFCLIASVSSKAFISSLSERILNETKQTRKEVKQIKKEVAPILAKETEAESQENEPTSDRESPQALLGLTDRDKTVLRALANSRFTLRTRTGIANDTGIQRSEVTGVLGELVSKGFVGRITKEGNKYRWYITPFGRKVAERE